MMMRMPESTAVPPRSCENCINRKDRKCSLWHLALGTLDGSCPEWCDGRNRRLVDFENL